jgi:hypothetical protein
MSLKVEKGDNAGKDMKLAQLCSQKRGALSSPFYLPPQYERVMSFGGVNAAASNLETLMRMAFWDDEPTSLAPHWTKIVTATDERVCWSGPHGSLGAVCIWFGYGLSKPTDES